MGDCKCPSITYLQDTRRGGSGGRHDRRRRLQRIKAAIAAAIAVRVTVKRRHRVTAHQTGRRRRWLRTKRGVHGHRRLVELRMLLLVLGRRRWLIVQRKHHGLVLRWLLLLLWLWLWLRWLRLVQLWQV
jgi:hypothetical protein